MGWLRKKAKQIGNAFKKVGKVLKKGLGKIGKFFGKLGPLGSLALTFMFSTFGGPILQWLNNIPGVKQIGNVFKGIKSFAGDIGKSVYGTVTEGIQAGINRIGTAFGKEGVGDGFKTFVDNITGLGETTTEAVADTATDVVADTATDAVSGQTTFGPVRENPKFSTEAIKETVEETVEQDNGFFTRLKNNPEDGFFKNFKESDEGKIYKKFNAVGKTGSIINQAEEDEEYLRQMQAQNEASYFSTQGQALLASTGADNYSRSGTGINFLDTSAFNPEMEPSSQYLNMRGLPTTIDPRDAPGYGFDYEAFLREQMVA